MITPWFVDQLFHHRLLNAETVVSAAALYELAAISPSQLSTAAYKRHHILPSSDFNEECMRRGPCLHAVRLRRGRFSDQKIWLDNFM